MKDFIGRTSSLEPPDEYPTGIEHSEWLWDGPTELPCDCYLKAGRPDPDCNICGGSGWEREDE